MADSLSIADVRKEMKRNVVCSESPTKQRLVASIPKHYSQKTLKRIGFMDPNIFGLETAAKIGLFLLKTALLEAVRRFSKAYCPFLWHSIQALQFVCLPPLKWIQKWGIFRGLRNFMQALSRPLLVLSVATSFSDWSTHVEDTSDRSDASQPWTDPQSNSPSNMPSEDSSGGVMQSRAPDQWILQLRAELEKEGMVLPERITEDELRRFYDAANGDFSSFLTSVKKTIRWRKKFRFLSVQELEDWSEMVFWHGCDVKRHPCLIIRLAPACSNIIPGERSRLPEVVVSQIEYGILHLVHAEDPLVTVLMDCEKLTPFHFPLQMMRSCATLLQDHYPNRLAALFVVRLPPIARVIAQTLFQVLRPGTRQKLRIIGEDYRKVLSKYLQTLPSFLGGDCSCPRCSKLNSEDNNTVGPSRGHVAGNDSSTLSSHHSDDFKFVKCDKVLKAVAIGLLLLLLCIVISVKIHDLEGLHLRWLVNL